MMQWFGNGIRGSGHALMIVSVVAFWGIVIPGFMLLFRSDGRGDKQSEMVLARPLNHGEIDKAKYRDRLLTVHAGDRS